MKNDFNLKGKGQKKKGSSRKVGRNLSKCKRYRDESRRTRNKARKLARILKGYKK